MTGSGLVFHRRRNPARSRPALVLLVLLALVCGGVLAGQTAVVTTQGGGSPATVASVSVHGDSATAPMGDQRPDDASPPNQYPRHDQARDHDRHLGHPGHDPGWASAHDPGGPRGDLADHDPAPGPRGDRHGPDAAPTSPHAGPDSARGLPGGEPLSTPVSALDDNPHNSAFQGVRGQTPLVARAAGDERPLAPLPLLVLTGPHHALPFRGAPWPGPAGDRLVDRDGHPGPRPGRAPPSSLGI